MKFLTMNMYINAWLDCSKPFISIHNKFDDDVLLYLNTEKVRQLLESGDICVEDFQITDDDQQLDVIANLLAIKSSERIKEQLKDLQGTIKERTPKQVTNIPGRMVKSSDQALPVTVLHTAVQ